jgi:hypothetical protein
MGTALALVIGGPAFFSLKISYPWGASANGKAASKDVIKSDEIFNPGDQFVNIDLICTEPNFSDRTSPSTISNQVSDSFLEMPAGEPSCRDWVERARHCQRPDD